MKKTTNQLISDLNKALKHVEASGGDIRISADFAKSLLESLKTVRESAAFLNRLSSLKKRGEK